MAQHVEALRLVHLRLYYDDPSSITSSFEVQVERVEE